MARYRVSKDQQLSHSERVDVKVPTVPHPTVAVGYERRDLTAGDELELNDADAKRLQETGVVEPVASSKRRRSK